MKKNYLKKTLNIIILIIILLNIFKKYPVYCKNIANNQIYENKKYNSLYKKCNEKYCRCLNTLTLNKILTTNNTPSYSLTPNNISEIKISNNSFNIKNIYLKNYNLLIFHQLGHQFINAKKIYNFGLGYRSYYYNNWVIGNHIFYDTLLSKNGKKIFSLGHEFLTQFIHITINTYHNTSNNNLIKIHNRQFLPFAYDVYIKNHLSFVKNTYGTINIERCFKNNTIYKLILGLNYTPTEIFTINIKKTIFNSIKHNETTFSIIANYKITLPWIYQTYGKHRKKINYTKIWPISNNEYAIYRNHSILFQNANSNNTEQNIMKEHYNTQHMQTNKLQNQVKKHESSNIDIPFMPQELQCINYSEEKLKNHQTQIYPDNGDTSNTVTQQKNNYYCTNIHNNNHQNQTTNFENIHSSHRSQAHQISQISQDIVKQPEAIHNDNHKNILNIPPPPPMLNLLPMTHHNDPKHIQNDLNDDIIQINDSHHDLTYDIKNIKNDKTNKFSLIGNEEHLLKLQRISQKRKKTLSTSSNDSNNSESIRVLKIIERQSILTTTNDTDSDNNQDTSTSDNGFSE